MAAVFCHDIQVNRLFDLILPYQTLSFSVGEMGAKMYNITPLLFYDRI